MSRMIASMIPSLANARGEFEIIGDKIDSRIFIIKHIQSKCFNATKLLSLIARLGDLDIEVSRSEMILNSKVNTKIKKWLRSKRGQKIIGIFSDRESVPSEHLTMTLSDHYDEFNGIYLHESMKTILLMELAQVYLIRHQDVFGTLHG